jgi:hypothetical protein
MEYQECDAGAIHGEACDHEADHLIEYVPAYLAATADAAGSPLGMQSQIYVCQRCLEDLLDHWLDAKGIVR